MTENHLLSAPLNGTLRYPATALVTLTRRIITQYEKHLDWVESTAEDPDSDERWDAIHEAPDIDSIYWNIDRERWTKIQQARGKKIPSEDLVGFDDPKLAEGNLLIIGRLRHSDIFQKAIKLRRDTRGQPEAGKDWSNEDALLDFLQFLSITEHAGLFCAA
jgi:hypothetical protein